MNENGKRKYTIENKIIIEDWDYEKNCYLNFDSIKLGNYSNKKAWWKCSKVMSGKRKFIHKVKVMDALNML